MRSAAARGAPFCGSRCWPRRLPGAKGGASSDRLVVARPTDAVSLDPARTSDIESLEVAEQVYGRLVRFSAGRLEPEADLATAGRSARTAPSGRSTCARTCASTTARRSTPTRSCSRSSARSCPSTPPTRPTSSGPAPTTTSGTCAPPGRYRVQFEIDRPYAPFLANLAMGPAAIVSPTAVRKWKRDFGRHPVGAGPYRFVEWIPGDRITLERNPDYWDEPAHTRYLVLIAMPDSRQRLQALESGAADVIQQLAPDDLPLVRLNPDLALAMAPATLVSYLAMNTQRRPAERPAHPARDRARREPRRAGEAGLPGARDPGDRSAAAQRLGRPLRRRDLSLRSAARAQAAGGGGLAGRSRGAAEAVRAVGGEPVHAGARRRVRRHHQALPRRGRHRGRRHPERARRSPARAVGGRARSRAARLVQRQRRSRQLPLHAARLRQHDRDAAVEHRVLQQRLVPRRHRHGAADDRSEGSDGAHRARAAVLAGAGDPGDRRSLGAAGALEGRVRAARRRCAGWSCSRRRWAFTAGRSTRDEPRRRATTARAATRATAARTRERARLAPTGSAAPKRRAAPKGREWEDVGRDARVRQQPQDEVVERQPAPVQHLPRRRVAGPRRQRLVAAR